MKKNVIYGVSFRFKREEHLKKKNEIREVFSKGKRIGCQGAKLFILKNNLPHNRICFTLSKGFGNSVNRNYARRICREAYRNLNPRLKKGFDFVLLVYAENTLPVFDIIAGRLNLMLSKAGLLQ